MYLRSVDVLRGISIFLVLLHHFNIPYKLHDTWLGFEVFGESFSTLVARNGNYGVTMFFVISGFLITQHSLKRHGQLAKMNIRAFYMRRIARIMPCLLLLVGCVSLLGAFNLAPFVNHTPNGITVSYSMTIFAALTFWMNLLIIHYGWVNYALGVLWSLAVEEVFYLVFPLLCVLTRGKTAFWILLLGVIAYAPYFRSLYFLDENEVYLYHYFASFDAIAIGCVTGLLWCKSYVNRFKQQWVQYVIVLCMLALYVYAPIKQVASWSMTVFAALTALLILSFRDDATIKKKLRPIQKGWIWLGKRSYELYLFHLIVLGLIKVQYLPAQTTAITKLILLPIFLFGSCVLAAMIEKYYATPLNVKIRNWYLGEDKK
ncbi:acyltransferase [Acinetobacter sp. MD2]|uniref:acyltransferase family protein n=1 Tax=Acinetobacter sp. MD2 TaxID=2600066 RepID=UPI002D1F1E33|nr:acyltransferase [Acinetobacter sp. MD2]MEB3767701.1 acyltransferase [Acinetobacter sp. MD2]